jgi:hypothetical protein
MNWRLKSRPGSGGFFVESNADGQHSIVHDILRGVTRSIFHVASGFVRRTFRLVDLSFRLHVLIVCHFACGVFDGTLCLFKGSLYVFTIHISPHCISRDNSRNRLWFQRGTVSSVGLFLLR